MAGVGTIVSLGFGTLIPFVAIYLKNEAGLSPQSVGGVMLISAVIGAAGRMVGGELTDRIGRVFVIRGVLILRILTFVLMALLSAARAHWGWIITGFALTRFFGAAIQPAVGALVADVVAPANRVKAYGLLKVGQNVGWAIGAASGGFILHSLGYPALFSVPAVVGVIGLVLAWIWLSETAAEVQRGQFDIRDVLSVFTDGRFVVFCGCCLLLFLLMGQYLMTLSLYMTEHIRIDEAHVGMVYSMNGAMVALFQWPISLLIAGMALRKPLVAGCLFYVVGYLAIAWAGGFGPLLWCMVIITLGEMVFTPAASTAVAAMAPGDRIGRYMGLYGLCESVGWSVGPAIGGVLLGLYAIRPDLTAVVVWGPVAALGVVAGAGFWLVMGPGRPRTAPQECS